MMIAKAFIFAIYYLAYLSIGSQLARPIPSLLYVGAVQYTHDHSLRQQADIFSIPYPTSNLSGIPRQKIALSIFNTAIGEFLDTMIQISEKGRTVSAFILSVINLIREGNTSVIFTINYLIIDPKWDQLIGSQEIYFDSPEKRVIKLGIRKGLKKSQSRDLKIVSFINSIQISQGQLIHARLQSKVSINQIWFEIKSRESKKKARETKFSIIYFFNQGADRGHPLFVIFQPLFTNLEVYPAFNNPSSCFFYGLAFFGNSPNTNFNSYIKSYQINQDNLQAHISAFAWRTLSCPPNLPFIIFQDQTCLSSCPVGFIVSKFNHCLSEKQQQNKNFLMQSKSLEIRILQSCSIGYFLDTGICRLCSERFFYCASCNSTQCLYCVSGYGLANNRLSCFLCSVPNCFTCSPLQVCMSCIAGYYLRYGSCNLCSTTFQNCVTCNQVQCMTCESSFVLAADFLSCVPRFTNSCSIANCNICTTLQQECVNCAGSFYLSVSSCLPCLNKFSNCQICTPFICESCLPGFNLTRNQCVNSSSLCPILNCLDCPQSISDCLVCYYGYQLVQNMCRPKCGDFYKTEEQVCDDGNTQPGDGCSDICLIENNFSCQQHKMNPLGSLCYYNGVINLEKLYIKKVSSKNQIQIKYVVLPINLSLWKYVNVSNIFTIQSVVPIQQYTTQLNADGTVSIFVDYSQNIQGQMIDVILDPSQSGLSIFSKLPQIRQQFIVSPSNNQIADFYSQQVYSLGALISILSIVVTGISFLFLLIGFVTGKMIGIQLIGVIQITFFSLLSLHQVNPCFAALSSLRYINGYNSLGSDPMLDIYSPSTAKGVFLFSRYTQNLNITLILIAIPLIFSLIILLLSQATCQKNKKCSEIGKKILGQYTLTALMFCGYMSSVSLALEIVYGRNNQSDLIGEISIFECCLLPILFLIYFILLLKKPELFGEYVKSFSQERMIYRLYYNWMILQRLIVGSTLVFMVSSSVSCIIPVLTFSFFSIFVLFFKPHISKVHSYRVFGNYAISLIIQIFYFSYEKSGPHKSDSSFIYIPLIIIILLLLCSIYNSIAIVYFLVQYVKSTNSKGQDEEEFSEMAKNERKMQKIRQRTDRYEEKQVRLNTKGEETNRNLRNIKKQLKSFRQIDSYQKRNQIKKGAYDIQDKEAIRSTRKRLYQNDSDQI